MICLDARVEPAHDDRDVAFISDHVLRSMRIPSCWNKVRMRQMMPAAIAPRRPSATAASMVTAAVPVSSKARILFAYDIACPW